MDVKDTKQKKYSISLQGGDFPPCPRTEMKFDSETTCIWSKIDTELQ